MTVESGRTIAGETRGATRQMALKGRRFSRRENVPFRDLSLNDGRFPLARLSLCPFRAARDRSVTEHPGPVEQGLSWVMKHKNSHLLVGYWSRLRRGRSVPEQSDIDPRAIKRLLPYVFILDCENPVRPTYRLAGTSLCERFGYELKGTSFLAHWEAQSGLSLASLLSQARKAGQPLCLTSIAATADNGMAELESVLAPVSLRGGHPMRFLGLVQTLSDPTPLLGHAIAYERLIGSQLIQEDEPLPRYDQTPPPPPPPAQLKSHPKAPYLRLVVDRKSPALLNFGSGDLLQQMVQVFSRAANREDDSRII